MWSPAGGVTSALATPARSGLPSSVHAAARTASNQPTPNCGLHDMADVRSNKPFKRRKAKHTRRSRVKKEIPAGWNWKCELIHAAATKLKPFAFSSRASRLRGESPAQDSPRSRAERQERENFAKTNPFLPAKDFRVLRIRFHLRFLLRRSINKVKLERMKIGEPVVLDGR